MLANIRLYLYAALAAAIFSAGWYVNGLRWESKAADAAQVAEKQRLQDGQEAAKLIEEATNEKQRIKIVYRTINHVDDTCSFGAEFVREYNRISQAAGHASQLNEQVP